MGFTQLALLEQHAAEIEVGELVAAIALRGDRLFEPGYGLGRLAERDHVHTDVVVRVAEIGIHLDRDPALRYGFFDAAKIAQRPAEKRVRFRCWARLDRCAKRFDRALVLAQLCSR